MREYGLDKSEVSRILASVDKYFSEGAFMGNHVAPNPNMHPLFAGFAKWKLYYLLPVSSSILEPDVRSGRISPHTSVKEIRKYVTANKTKAATAAIDGADDESFIPPVFDPANPNYTFDDFQKMSRTEMLNSFWELYRYTHKKRGGKFTVKRKLNLLEKWAKMGGRRKHAEYMAERKLCSVSSLYDWKKAYVLHGEEGLKNKSSRPKKFRNFHTRKEMKALKTVIEKFPNYSYPQLFGELRANFAYTRSFEGMYHRITHSFLMPRKEHRKYERTKRPVPIMIGLKCQMDVKYVPTECLPEHMRLALQDSRKNTRWYQYSLVDKCNRELFVFHYDSFGVAESIDFATRAFAYLGYKPYELKTDWGGEFEKGFTEWLNKHGIEHRHSEPASPWQNGMVERIHRTCNEEFYNGRVFKDLEDLRAQAKEYMIHFNTIRVHSALRSSVTGKRYITPQEKRNELLDELTSNSEIKLMRIKQNKDWALQSRKELYRPKAA